MRRSFLFRPFGVTIWTTILLAAGFLTIGPQYFSDLELNQLQQRFRLRAEDPDLFPSEIALVEINENSENARQPWPWSWERMAQLVKRVRETKPKAIIIEYPLIQGGDLDQQKKWKQIYKLYQERFPRKRKRVSAAKPAPRKSRGRRRRRKRSSPPPRPRPRKVRKAKKAKKGGLRYLIEKAAGKPGEKLRKELKRFPKLVLGFSVYRQRSDVPGSQILYLKNKDFSRRMLASMIENDKGKKKGKKKPDKDKKKDKKKTDKDKKKDKKEIEKDKKKAAKAKKEKEKAAKEKKEEREAKKKRLAPAALTILQKALSTGLPSKRDPAPEYNFVRDNPLFAKSIRFHGFLNLGQHPERTIHKVPLFVQKDSKVYPSLALSAYIALFGEPARTVQDGAYQSISLKNISVPLTRKGELWLNYYGPSSVIRKNQRHSAGELIFNKDYNAEGLKDKIVFIGVSSSPHAIKYKTPYKKPFSSLELQATVLAHLMQGRTLVREEGTRYFELGLLVILCLLLGFLLTQFRSFIALFTLVAFLGGLWFFERFYLVKSDHWYQLLYIQASLVLLFFIVTWFRRVTVDKEESSLIERFQSRLGKEDLKVVLKKPGKVPLDGTGRVLTVISAGAKPLGAGLTEESVPQQINGMLSHLVNPMADAIGKNKGAITSLAGSSFQGVFNAPFELKDHAHQACLSALQMKFVWESFVLQWQQEGFPTPSFGVGLDTGYCIFGNFGGDSRFVYSAVGEPIDWSRQLQELNKAYGSHILISEELNEQLSETGKFLIRELDRVRISDEQPAFPVYELLGKAPGGSPNKEAVEWYQHGLSYYRSRSFQDAARYFQQLLQLRPSDGPAQVMLKRCQHYVMYPPGFQWDGAWKIGS